jgi:hypothetical protein
MVSLALLPLGYVLAGPLASAIGSVEILLGGSALAALALALGLLPHETRMLRRLRPGTSGVIGTGAAQVADARPGLPRR